MFILVSEVQGSYYLLENEQYTIGRKNCDILLKNDNSISKKHAVIKFEDNNIYLTDVGSKYNTFVNKKKLQINEPMQLKEGDQIEFGQIISKFRLEYKSLLVLCSSLSQTDKLKLTKIVEKLNGTLLKKWNKNCTHLVVQEIMLTSKVLSAIIEGIPMVTLKFWEDMLANIQNNIPLPVEADYVPPTCEMFLSKSLSFNYIPERKLLFKNKVFVFRTSETRANLEDIIVQGGGKCILYAKEQITDEKLTSDSPQYLFVSDNDNSQQPAGAFDNIAERLKKLNKRLIPQQEIAMALLVCCCVKNCNPDFDRVGTLMAPGDGHTSGTPIMLAMESQSQNQTQLGTVKTEGFAPDTFEPDIFAPVVQAPWSSTQVDVVDLFESTLDNGGVKRLGEELSNVDSKRKKIEEQECVRLLSPIAKVEPKKTVQQYLNKGKETLVFDKRQETASNTSKRKSHDQISEKPAKRRNERINPFAVPNKPSASSNTTQISSNESTSKRNPFATLAKLSQTCQSKYEPGEADAINADDDNVAYLEHNPVDIKQKSTTFIVTPIDPATERSFGWLSKSQVQEGHVDVKLEPSNPLAALLESFRGCVVVETKQLVVSRGRCDVGQDTIDESGRHVKNFKKFKKVKPLRVQSTVVPQSAYIRMVCNQSQAISCNSDDDDVDNVLNPFTRTDSSQPKKSGRKIYGI